MTKNLELKTQASDYYTSDEFWKNNLGKSSSFKVKVVDALLKKSSLDLPRFLNVAEIGCGDGAFLLPLASLLKDKGVEFKIVGYDISQMAIEQAKSNNYFSDSHVSFHVAPVEDIPHNLDIIFCIDVLEHVENPWEILRGLAGKSQYLILHLPIEQSLGHWITGACTRSNKAYNHIHFFSWESARLMLKESPFEIVDFQITGATNFILTFNSGNFIKKFIHWIRYVAYKFSPQITSAFSGGSVMFLLKNR